MKTLTDAIQQFRNDIDDSDYANLGAMSPKSLILTLPVVFFHVHEPIAPKL